MPSENMTTLDKVARGCFAEKVTSQWRPEGSEVRNGSTWGDRGPSGLGVQSRVLRLWAVRLNSPLACCPAGPRWWSKEMPRESAWLVGGRVSRRDWPWSEGKKEGPLGGWAESLSPPAWYCPRLSAGPIFRNSGLRARGLVRLSDPRLQGQR